MSYYTRKCTGSGDGYGEYGPIKWPRSDTGAKWYQLIYLSCIYLFIYLSQISLELAHPVDPFISFLFVSSGFILT